MIWTKYDSINVRYLKEYIKTVFRDLYEDKKCSRYGFTKLILLYRKWKLTNDLQIGQWQNQIYVLEQLISCDTQSLFDEIIIEKPKDELEAIVFI